METFTLVLSLSLPLIFFAMICLAIAFRISNTKWAKKMAENIKEKLKPKPKPVVEPVKDSDLPPLCKEVYKRMKKELSDAKFDFTGDLSYYESHRWKSKKEKDDFLREANQTFEDRRTEIFSKWYEKMTPEEYYEFDKVPIWPGYVIPIAAIFLILSFLGEEVNILLFPFAFMFGCPIGAIWGYIVTNYNAETRKSMDIDNMNYRLKDARNIAAMTALSVSSVKSIKETGKSFKPQKSK